MRFPAFRYLLAALKLSYLCSCGTIPLNNKHFYLQVEAPGQSYDGSYLNIPAEFGPCPSQPDIGYAQFFLMNAGNPQYGIKSSPGRAQYNIDSASFVIHNAEQFRLYTVFSPVPTHTDFIQLSLAVFYPQTGPGAAEYAQPVFMHFNQEKPNPTVPTDYLFVSAEDGGKSVVANLGVDSAYQAGKTWVVCGGDDENWSHSFAGPDVKGNPVNYRPIYFGKPGVWKNPMWGVDEVQCIAVKLKVVDL